MAKLLKKGKIFITRLTNEALIFNVAVKLILSDLNYNCECDWLIELGPSDNNLVENRSSLNQ